MKLMMIINNEPSLADVLCFTANSLTEVRQTDRDYDREGFEWFVHITALGWAEDEMGQTKTLTNTNTDP